MPLTYTLSPVANAIAKVLEVLHPNSVAGAAPPNDKQYLILSYSNVQDFNFLWKFWEDEALQEAEVGTENSAPNGDIIKWSYAPIKENPENKNLIIVWDGIPNPQIVGNVYLGSYVTPYDWVMAFFFMLESGGFAGRPPIQITIIDLISSENSASESARLYQQLHLGESLFLNWVQVYRPAARFGTEKQISNFLCDIEEAEVNSSSNTSLRQPSANSLDWQVLRRIWEARLVSPSEPRNRHAIANIVGPQLLIAAMNSRSAISSNADSPCLAALLTLMRCLGLFPDIREMVSAPWVKPIEWKNYNERETAPVFVLLDDMHDLGWSEFIRLSLGINPTAEQDGTLILADAPDAQRFGTQRTKSLLDLLTDETGRLRVKEGLDLGGGEKDTILFLDLRLFNQRRIEDEMEFFKELLILARQVEENGSLQKDLPWAGFTSQEIHAIEDCIVNEKIESDCYFIALTLLPRLISLVDPMLPIILFSSTGQRRISEALKAYGNIITDFDKPRFFVEACSGIVEETRHRFERAVNRALMLLKGRSVCRQFKTGSNPDYKDNTEYYVEIFIDEADEVAEETFRVGGLAIIYEDERQAEKFNKGMIQQGLTWGSTDIEENPTNIIDKRLPRFEDYQATIYDPVDQLLKAIKVKGLVGFTLAAQPDRKWIDSTDLTSPWCLDNLYRNLVSQAIETLFYEVLPEKIGQKEPHFSCGVYVACRKRCQSDADAPRDWDPKNNRMNITGRYGIKIKPDNKCTNGRSFQSISSDDVYPMVAKVRALMPNANIKVITARGSQLRYGVDISYPESLPRPAHLLADPVVSLSNTPYKLKKQPSLKSWIDQGFTSVADDRFVATLQACLYARAGRHIEAILEAYKASLLSASKKEIEWWSRTQISRSIASLSGGDFVKLCLQLTEANI